MVKLRPPVCPPTLTVTSRRRPVLGGVTETQNMLSLPKTHTPDLPTCRTSRCTAANWRLCTRSRREKSTPSSNQWCFSPTPKSMKFWSSPTLRPTRPKTSKTMAPFVGQHPDIPAALNPRRHLGCLSQASTMPLHQGQRCRSTSTRRRPPGCPPPRRRLHALWGIP